jgi:hypothetical protein
MASSECQEEVVARQEYWAYRIQHYTASIIILLRKRIFPQQLGSVAPDACLLLVTGEREGL